MEEASWQNELKPLKDPLEEPESKIEISSRKHTFTLKVCEWKRNASALEWNPDQIILMCNRQRRIRGRSADKDFSLLSRVASRRAGLWRRHRSMQRISWLVWAVPKWQSRNIWTETSARSCATRREMLDSKKHESLTVKTQKLTWMRTNWASDPQDLFSFPTPRILSAQRWR